MRNLHRLTFTLGASVFLTSLGSGLEANASPSNSSVRPSALQGNNTIVKTQAIPQWQDIDSATATFLSASVQEPKISVSAYKADELELKESKILEPVAEPEQLQSVKPVVAAESVASKPQAPDVQLQAKATQERSPLSSSTNTSAHSAAKRQINADLGIIEVNREVLTAQSSEVVGDTFSPEEVDRVRESLLVEPLIINQSVFIPLPGSNFGTPSGFGASWGSAFTGISYASAGDTFKDDGSAILGIGFGDSLDAVGLELDFGINSLDGFADDGTLGFKVHKAFSTRTAVSVGWANPVRWGDADNNDDTIYGSLTHRFDLKPNNVDNQLPLTVTLGVGTGAYRSVGAIDADDNTPNLFASAGLRVIPRLSMISTWTGNSLNLGVSTTPFNLPVVFNIGVVDVTDNLGDGTRLFFSSGYAFNFF